MVVDALMQIPWLVAIVNAVVWVGKAVWEFVGKQWRIVAAWFATAVPIVLRWMRERLAYRLLVLGLWVTLITAVWSAIVQFAGGMVVAAFPSTLGSNMGPFASFFWNEPFNFSVAWGYIRTLWGLHMAALSIRVLWLRFRWAYSTGQKTLS